MSISNNTEPTENQSAAVPMGSPRACSGGAISGGSEDSRLTGVHGQGPGQIEVDQRELVVWAHDEILGLDVAVQPSQLVDVSHR